MGTCTPLLSRVARSAANWAGTATVQTTAGTDSVVGNGVGTTLSGPTSGDYTITAARAGTVGGTTFSAVGTITAGTGDDNVTGNTLVTPCNGTKNGGGIGATRHPAYPGRADP